MTGAEFGLHAALADEEPLPEPARLALQAVLAALANGPLKPPAASRLWRGSDFAVEPWQIQPLPGAAAASPPQTVAEILATAAAFGMH